MMNELQFIQSKLTMANENRQETIEYLAYKISRKELKRSACGCLQNLYTNNVSYMWRQ
jgi:hypothetical protein